MNERTSILSMPFKADRTNPSKATGPAARLFGAINEKYDQFINFVYRWTQLV